MATTIRDVAHRAGVSIATVSRALRDATSVTPETRARVTQAAADLEYVPSQLGPPARPGPARRQRHRLPRPVGPVLRRGRPRLRVRGRPARPVGADPLDPRPARRRRPGRPGSPPAATAWSCSGRTVDDEVVHRLHRRGTPLVLVARTPLVGVDSVNAENNASGALARRAPRRRRSADDRSSSATPTRPPTSPSASRPSRRAAERDGASVDASSPSRLRRGGRRARRPPGAARADAVPARRLRLRQRRAGPRRS